jgi:hypothetical protein
VSRFLAFYAEALLNPHWGEQVAVRPDNVLKISMVYQGLNGDQARAVWRPFLDWVAAHPTDYAVVEDADIGGMPMRQWWDAAARRASGSTAMRYDSRPGAPPTHAWWSGDQGQVSAFFHAFDSLWLPASLLSDDQRARLAEALIAASRRNEVELHFNKGLAGASAPTVDGARDTAMNPDVLSAFALAIMAAASLPAFMSVLGYKPDLAAAHRSAAGVAAAAAALRQLAPTAGSYLSESDYFNADWRRAFWGSNHPRLAGVKAKYDPEGLFFVHHGVGSEAWSADGFERAT